MKAELSPVDALWAAPPGLALFGLPLPHIVLSLALVFGLLRVVHAAIDLYDKLKERRNAKRCV